MGIKIYFFLLLTTQNIPICLERVESLLYRFSTLIATLQGYQEINLHSRSRYPTSGVPDSVLFTFTSNRDPNQQFHPSCPSTPSLCLASLITMLYHAYQMNGRRERAGIYEFLPTFHCI